MKQKTGRTLYYGGRALASLNGRGYETTHFDVETGDECWISGPRQDGRDTLHPGEVQVDDDARDDYWLRIRRRPDCVGLTSYRSPGRHARRSTR
jgi:hypothetical protein